MSKIQISYAKDPVYPFPTLLHPAYHSHPDDEMLIVETGDIIAMTQKGCLSHKGACVLFYQNHCPHAQINGQGVPYRRYYIHFDRSEAADVFPDRSLFAAFSREDAFLIPLGEAEAKRLLAAAEILNSLPEAPEEDPRRRLLLGYILAEVTEISRNQPRPQSVCFYLTAAARYISEHIAEKLTIDRIAENFGIGRTKLIRDFRETFSMTVLEYITMERLARARVLLMQGESVMETAERCGFSDSAHLIRVFRKYYGQTPAAYRRECSENPAGQLEMLEFPIRKGNGNAK